MPKRKFDVVIRYEDPSKDFAYLLYKGFKQNGIRVYMYEDGLIRPTKDDYFYKVSKQSMIFIALFHPEDAFLPRFVGTGVDLLKSYHDNFLLIVYDFSPGVLKKYETGCFGEALHINKAVYGAEVHEWKKAFYMELESSFDVCNVIDLTKGYQSSIDEIIKRFSKMIYEEYPGKNLVETERLKVIMKKYMRSELSSLDKIKRASKRMEEESPGKKKYDVVIRCEDPSKDFAYLLYKGFKQNGIRVYIYEDGLNRDAGNDYFYKVSKQSMIFIALCHPEDAFLPRFVGTGVDLLESYHDNFLLIVYDFSPGVRKKYETGCFGEALDINKAAYGAEVHEWKKAFYMKSSSDGCNVIDLTKGYQSSIDEIIKRFSKMIYEVSPGRKGFQLTWFLEERLAIYWDFNCSPFPTNVNPEDIAKTIIAFVKETKTNWAAVDIYAYGHSSEEQQKKLRSSLAKQNVTLHHMGVTLIHTPRGRKDTTFFALLVDMLKRSHSFPAPSPIILISANISYANALHALGLLGHKTMLLTSSEVGVSVPLINASVYTCSDVAKGASSSQVQIKELPNNCPGSMLVKRNDLVATSSSQVEELSMRFKYFRSIDPCGIDFFTFWDFENCPIPKEVPTKDVAFNIIEFIEKFVTIGHIIPRIRAYADFSRIHGEVRESSEKTGVKLINTPHVIENAADVAMIIDSKTGVKLKNKPHVIENAADVAMIIDLFMYSKLVCPRSPIMVIAGDVDFATTLHAIGFRHDIFLAVPSRVGVSESLTSASKDYWFWEDVVNGRREKGSTSESFEK